MKINIFFMYVLSVLFITRFANILPSYFGHIEGILRIQEIGLFIGIVILFSYIISNKKSNLNNKVLFAYIFLLIYVFVEFIRTIIIWNQGFLLTFKVEKHLLYGIFMIITPLILINKSRLYTFLKILLSMSLMCAILYLYQAITKQNIFSVKYIIQEIGGFQFFRTFESYPEILIFFSLGFIYYLLSIKTKWYKKEFCMGIIILISLSILFLNVTRNSWAIFFISVVLLFFLSWRKRSFSNIFPKITLFLFLIILIFTFVSPLQERLLEGSNDMENMGGTFGYRIELFKERINIIKDENLFFGVGLINVHNDAYDHYFKVGGIGSTNQVINTGDNGFAGLICHLGLLGFIIYLAFILISIIYIYNIFKKVNSLNYESILATLVVLGISLLIGSFFGPGIYGYKIIYLFLSVGIAKAVENIYYKEVKHEKT